MKFLKDSQAPYSLRTFRITLTGLDLLALIVVSLTATSEPQALKSVEPLVERKKPVAVESQAQTLGSNT